MLSNWKAKLTGGLKSISGRKDFLEAVCAASALVASADGEVSDDEIKTTVKVVSSNPMLTAAYKSGDIEKCIDTMLKRAAAGRTGRMGLYKEIEEVSSNGEMAETAFLCAVDVAESNGTIEPVEQKTLSEIAKRLGVNPSIANV